MRSETYQLAVVAGQKSDPHPMRDVWSWTIEVSGTWNGSLAVTGSVSSNYYGTITMISSNGIYHYPDWVLESLIIDATSVVSGTPVVWISQRNGRTF